jgi:hypothetical protein
MSVLARKTALLAKLESVYGVDALPTTDDLIEVVDFSISPEIDKVERNLYRPTLSPNASLPAKKYTQLSFTVELKGGGVDANGVAVAPKVVEIMQACGMSLTINEYDDDNDGNTDRREYVLKPTSENIPSLTFYAYLDGVLYKVLGARGDMKLQLEANQIGKMQFEFTGLFVEPVDAPFPTISCNSDIIPPIIQNVNLTMGGYAPILSSFEVGLNNDIVQLDDMNAPAGVGEVIIQARKTGGSLNPDMMLASEYDIWTKFINNEEVEIKATIGNNTGNTIDIDIPKAIYNKIGIGERDSVRIYNVDFTATGCDDELIITFK